MSSSSYAFDYPQELHSCGEKVLEGSAEVARSHDGLCLHRPGFTKLWRITWNEDYIWWHMTYTQWTRAEIHPSWAFKISPGMTWQSPQSASTSLTFSQVKDFVISIFCLGSYKLARRKRIVGLQHCNSQSPEESHLGLRSCQQPHEGRRRWKQA